MMINVVVVFLQRSEETWQLLLDLLRVSGYVYMCIVYFILIFSWSYRQVCGFPCEQDTEEVVLFEVSELIARPPFCCS